MHLQTALEKLAEMKMMKLEGAIFSNMKRNNRIPQHTYLVHIFSANRELERETIFWQILFYLYDLVGKEGPIHSHRSHICYSSQESD